MPRKAKPKAPNYVYYPFATTFKGYKTENRHRSKKEAIESYLYMERHYGDAKIMRNGKDVTPELKKWLKSKDI